MIVRLTILSLCSLQLAAFAAEDSSVVQDARQALRENIPQVAVQKLRTYLAASPVGAPERGAAAVLLAEAFIATGKPENVESVLAESGVPAIEARRLRAHAAAASGRWNDALEHYRQLRLDPSHRLTGELGEAESLAALGMTEEAVVVLEKIVYRGDADTEIVLRLAGLCTQVQKQERARKLLATVKHTIPTEAKWKRYVEGRIALSEVESLPATDTARQVFEELLRQREHVSEEVLFGATLGLSEARVRLSGSDAGHQVIENFIRRHPQSRYLEAAFKRLDRIYSEQEDPSETELQKWIQRMPEKAAGLATFYAARLNLRARKLEKTGELLKHFFASFRNHPLVGEAHLVEADMHLARGDSEKAMRALETAMRHATGNEQRGEIELRTAMLHHAQGEYLLAANLCRSAAERAPRLKAVATYNAALAWLGQKNADAFAQELQTLEQMPEGAALRADLLLERGLSLAREGDLLAEETLQLVLRQYPRHPRAGEARLALAELEFRALQASANPARRAHAAEQAAEYLRVANTESRTPEMAAHTDYLAVFLADKDGAGNDKEVIRLGEEFVRSHKRSHLLPDVRLKLGEVYYRVEDFANAETQFATLAEETPMSPYAEKALFLAGQSAMRMGLDAKALGRALGFFDRVVKREGPLKLYARQEQAIAQSRVGRENEAIALYDVILAAQPPPDPELRFAALCGKADNLAAMGRDDRAHLETAIGVFEQLAAAPNVTPVWRNQALYKKGKTLIQLGRTNEALTAYYDVLERSSSAEREHFWSAKAGFDAGSILEQQKQWKAAIGIYTKLAALGSPRAGEAEARVKQLRLDHFIWD